MQEKRFLGIFLNPVFVQCEGLNRVFDNLQSAGASAVCIVPAVSWPDPSGKRFPDLHVDGFRRLIARPAWDKREIHLKRALGYRPYHELYAQSPYKPNEALSPKEVDRDLPAAMLQEAKTRGMQAHMFCHPFLPPGIHPSDRPVRVDGSVGQPPQVALNACLSSPDARAYAEAQVSDIVRNFPDMDGLMPDWAEYGAYGLEDLFTCFCGHCQQKAMDAGNDWPLMKSDVLALWQDLHSLSASDLAPSGPGPSDPAALQRIFDRHPGWLQFTKFKSKIVMEFYQSTRRLLDAQQSSHISLAARGWPPPWNHWTGMDYARLADVVDAVTPKLFTFDYSAIPRWYGRTLQQWNPELPESMILDVLVDWLDLPDDLAPRSLDKYQIPAPDERHQVQPEEYRRRVDEVLNVVKGRAFCQPFAHAYLPNDQWRRMLTMLRQSPVHGIWVQMYGYLSDEKLAILAEEWQ